MSDEELNKKMEFIIEQQAQFASDIGMMRELHEADSKLVKDGLLGLVDIVGHLARSHMRTEDSINSLTQDVSRLEQAQARTDERLNIFINVVERFISGNGGAESPA
jgi:hypothetical protein